MATGSCHTSSGFGGCWKRGEGCGIAADETNTATLSQSHSSSAVGGRGWHNVIVVVVAEYRLAGLVRWSEEVGGGISLPQLNNSTNNQQAS